MRLVLLGAPGSGKGTQGEILSRRYSIPQIATGDILRSEMAAGTPLGRAAQRFVNSGALVPDDVILGMMGLRLAETDAAGGFVLDGFPRSIPQAEGLDRILSKTGGSLSAVLKLHVPKRLLLERLTARRVCPACGAVYNLKSMPPVEPDKCDRCGGPLVQRKDDSAETVRKRLTVYEAATAPLIDYYDAHGLLVIVHGEGVVEDVTARIMRGLAGKNANGRSGGTES